MTGRAQGWLVVGASALVLLGCGGGGGGEVGSTDTTAPPTTVGGDQPLRLAVVGDSIPFNAPEDCPDCTGFVGQFVESVEQDTGRPVRVDNFARHDSAGIAELLAQFDDDAQLAGAVGEADLVLVSIGTFDMPPWPPGAPCGNGASTPPQIAAQVLAYTPECVDQAVAGFQEGLAEIYSGVADLRADEPSVLIALTVYDVFLDDPRFAGLDPTQQQTFTTNMVLVHDRWNESACQLATADGFECVDVYHAFNGADGRTPVGDNVAADHIHPSQAGNDVIADLLAALDMSALAA